MPNQSRGPYPKGIARRQLILRAALDAYAEDRPTPPTIKEIAARAQLSERGLLHYFPSKADLLVGVVAERDSLFVEAYADKSPEQIVGDVLSTIAQTPGLTKVFLELAASALDTQHPAHAYFRARYRRLTDRMTDALVDASADPDDEAAADSIRWAVRMTIAAFDGLQIQWLLDPGIDITADLTRLARTLLASLEASVEA